MRTLTIILAAIATTAGSASAGILRMPIKSIPQSSKSENVRIPQSAESTTQRCLGVKLQINDQENSKEQLVLPQIGHLAPIRNTRNSFYACNISISTPAQELEVILDTGSSRLWLPSVPCESDNTENHNCRDVLRIGDLTVQNQPFAGAGAIPGVNISLDGILGLGYPHPSGESTDSLFYNMITQGLLDEPLFSLFLDGNDYNDSEIVFGGTNKDHYDGNIVYLPTRRGLYWEADLDTVSLGDQTIELDNTGAIFDSGTSVIALPETLAQVLNLQIGAKRGGNGQFFVDCNKRENLSDLTFTLAGHNFTLAPSDYIGQAEGSCVSLLVGLDISPPPGPVALLGVPFLRKWYSVYDLGKDAIGFAKAR